MSLNLPKMPKVPNADFAKPTMPQFAIPKLEPPQRRGRGKAQPPWDRKTKNAQGNARTDYSRLKASWKEESRPIAKANNPFSTLDLSLPDISRLRPPKDIQVSEEVQKLSLHIDQRIKEKVNAFTGKNSYEVGDITKAIIAKVSLYVNAT